MDLNKIYSAQRTGQYSQRIALDTRTAFQRDFDRIIFSSAFRRLQNKTQVFPLPGSVFVHNRLTHSLEVASVGRSLGNLIGDFIAHNYRKTLSEESMAFYQQGLSHVLAAACLCHDIGNPAFGHSGEDAIASYFVKNEAALSNRFSRDEWTDFIHFEGNANAIRVLTNKQKGKSDGGMQLTYSTLAAIAKYPCESRARNKKVTHRKKFGFLQSEKEIFQDIAKHTGMKKDQNQPLGYYRHPFVWLVEVADDICYTIIDFEDAHRLGIVEHSLCVAALTNLVDSLEPLDKEKVHQVVKSIEDKNEQVAYLRAKSISGLIFRASEIYKDNFESVVDYTFKTPLFNQIKKECPELVAIEKFSIENIYNQRNVLEIENAGYHVMYELLDHFITPILKKERHRSNADNKALRLLPWSFNYDHANDYDKVLGVIDYVSGMTDNYAADLYKKIKGISIGMSF